MFKKIGHKPDGGQIVKTHKMCLLLILILAGLGHVIGVVLVEPGDPNLL